MSERLRRGMDVEAAVAALDAAWAGALRSSTPAALYEVERHVRGLAVRGRQAGYRRIPEYASIIEVMLGPVLAGEDRLGSELRRIVDDYLRGLRDLARDPPEDLPDGRVHGELRVLLLGEDARLEGSLGPQLAHFDYRLIRQPLERDIVEQILAIDPDALLLDLDGGAASSLPSEFADTLAARLGGRIPLVAIAATDQIEQRLAAARAGIHAYQLKPVDVHELVDRLDAAGNAERNACYRILLVEDSPTQAAFFTAMLKRSDLAVTVMHQPLQVLDLLAEQPVDLILMDMYMPDCTGSELARVIRQYPAYAGIPIVFLSAETQLDRQLDALSLGGDDFLTKPIEAGPLVRTVKIRAERARTLRAFMGNDQLTGLLNHTRIKEQLLQEVARARRHGSPLAFAMLDLDRFKSVNDTHGHAVGDRVLKSLGRVLQQRLRETDYIGRYGGEEFAILLPGAAAAEARHVLDAVRQNFRRLNHGSGQGQIPIHVSFSAGVAELGEHDDAESLALLADRALYAAKAAGRNRVVLAATSTPAERRSGNARGASS